MKTPIKQWFLLPALVVGVGLIPVGRVTAQTLSVVVVSTLYSFSFDDTNGYYPVCGLVQGSDGNFYGTTSSGGTPSCEGGTVFKITTNGVLTTLYSFPYININPYTTDFPDGNGPVGVLVQGSDGNFYGTTVAGGTNLSDEGTVFKMSTNGVLTVLHSFTGGSDGDEPSAGLVQGSDGNFYGTTYKGGTGGGIVFEITTNGALTVLHSFAGSDGYYPVCGLVQGSDGNFYGTTIGGGTNVVGYGTVFKITTNNWMLTTLYSFTGGDDGGLPECTLVQGRNGNFYGTTYQYSSNNDATVFEITTNGVLTTLCEFGAFTDEYTPSEFAEPYTGLVQGGDGNFYGVTYGGGIYNNDLGTAYEITTNGALNVLHSFGPFVGGYGENPYGPLVQGSDGSFYGTTSGGGLGGAGTVFKMTIVPELPQLTITFVGPDSVVISWPDTGSYTLQTNGVLSTSNWIAYGGTVTTTNGTNSVTMTPPTGNLFFRLASP